MAARTRGDPLDHHPGRGGFGREAPVAYGDARRRLQWLRLAAGALLLLTCAVAQAGGAGRSFATGIAGLALLVDSAARLRYQHAPIWPFLVDAVCIGAIVGAGGSTFGPLVALFSYLLIGTILYVPQPGTVWVMVIAAVAYRLSGGASSPLVPEAIEPVAIAAMWMQVTVLFSIAGALLIDGAGHIRAARERQSHALDAARHAGQMKSDFVSMISPELRTPLTNIAGFAATLAASWRELDAGEIDEFLGIIEAESEHLGNLVDDVLAIPRLEAGRLLVDATAFALRPLAYRISDLVFPAGGEKQASVQVPGNVVVEADPNRVAQVLRNLLENARKYGGDRVAIESFRRGDEQVVVVADDGPGVPARDQDRIFEPFEQGSRGDTRTGGGVGLGLSVTRRLIEAMGGRVWYEPAFPVGARFCFSLPVADPGVLVTDKATGLAAVEHD